MSTVISKPDYLFEVSWEVCNKVGGIHTVVATKSVSLLNEYGNKFITVGPDLIHHTGSNPEFDEDAGLYSEWKKAASQQGLNVRVGYWNTKSRPIAILIDFSSLFGHKDEIFSLLWEEYKLDSLSGQWDYVEPTLFGYAVGKVIESFIRYNLSPEEKIVAQFHEWMTSSGILYLKKNLPQVATVFTTHATVLGRSLAGNNRPLYNKLESYNPEDVAKEFNIVSKQSLEKIAAREADAFTTVSEITARECKQFLGKAVDMITPNGFENSIVPNESEHITIRNTARTKMLQVASALLGQDMPDDSFIVATSGRYEFRNKGIDLFIESMAKVAEHDKLNRPILAMLLIPAHHYGARKDLLQALNDNQKCIGGSPFLTHNLHDPDWDPIMQRIKKVGLKNNVADKLKIIFVPSYLNGNDGVFNMPYYDLLMGCDQTVFPSYYEPWGYTPLESVAFSVPTITTTLAGFGLWSNTECKKQCNGISVIARDDTNDAEVVQQIAREIIAIYSLSSPEVARMRKDAFQISQIALWRSLVFFYQQAYHLALQNADKRADEFVDIGEVVLGKSYEHIRPLSNEPNWKQITVKTKLPGVLAKFEDIISNIWWTWDDEAQKLFEKIDPLLWRQCDYNPYILFERISYPRLEELSKDAKYTGRVERVHQRFVEYLKGAKDKKGPKIAYFSMEFGFHDSLKLYSGGLGILAGDYLKEASDAKVDLVGIGLLYRYGYFTQMITVNGEQRDVYEYQHFSKLPLTPLKNDDGSYKLVQVILPGRIMQARVFELKVGRISLYLMDTDIDTNRQEDREVTHKLYGGNNENRLKQELLLGFGGIRILSMLGIEPDLYHSNEGHSAFIGLERVRMLMQNEQLSFLEAKEIVRSTTLFTTHTPVPAGHDHFDEDLIRIYLGQYPNSIDLNWEKFMALGRANPNDWTEKFNMSYLAAHMAQETNGVSMLHGEVTRDMFTHLWPGFLSNELYIGHVTNGVHWPTWTASAWKPVYEEIFNNNFVEDQLDQNKWQGIYNIEDKRVWDIKESLRYQLINAVKNRFKENWIKRHEDPRHIVAINHTLSDKALTVVFARRFATYKRAHLLFRDIDKLAKLVNNPDKPIQFMFAGKAHPHDKAGQDLIKMIVEISKRPEFLGKILFLQNYSIELAKLLVSGADIWLNTPTRPLEASGTSGEKAVMNGTLHFSVLDGWWVEGYQPDAGWALTNERTYENQHFQDDLDAEIIYSLFQDEIVPAFYNRNSDGIPVEWVQYIKNNIASVAPKFTTRRMIDDYSQKYYSKLYERGKKLKANDFELATQLTHWKKIINHLWDKIEVLEVNLYEENIESVETGKAYRGSVLMDLKDIEHNQIGVELVITENQKEMVLRKEFELKKSEKTRAVYVIDATIDRPGTFQYGIRVFPKHPLLPHRQDFGHLRWI